jgi:glycosyltransferase involved in cell wall biosynthesis
MYKTYLPLMPLALEQLDLRGYDLVLSSESGPAKGIVAAPDAFHICYCHTPMRYIWNMYAEYRENAGFFTRLLMPPLAHYMRLWDASSSLRVDRFIANSRAVASRIYRYYGVNSEVIYPPVDVDAFSIAPVAELADYYLMVGELVSYKRPDLAVRAFNKMRRRLVVIGGGEMLQDIRRLAGPTITVLGPQPFDVLREHYAKCRALIFPGEEDFGMVPVEAMASGRPVLAYARGGALETVVAGVTGAFFAQQSEEAIIAAVQGFQDKDVDPQKIAAHARNFGRELFMQKMRMSIDQLTADGPSQRLG